MGSEVVNMLMSEYNYEQDIKVQREEAFEEGEKLGQELGKKIGKSEGITEGRQSVSKLIQILTGQNRFDDLKRASRYPEYLEELLREFDL